MSLLSMFKEWYSPSSDSNSSDSNVFETRYLPSTGVPSRQLNSFTSAVYSSIESRIKSFGGDMSPVDFVELPIVEQRRYLESLGKKTVITPF